MKNLILLFVFSTITISNSAFGQLKQKMADQLYKGSAYYDAAPMYDELADKTLAGKKSGNEENVRKAAISNFHLFKMAKAIHYFEYLNKKSALSEKDREYYIQALRYDKRYSEAETLINESSAKFPSNGYFAELKNNLPQFHSLFADSSYYKINPTKISSIYGDFSPSFYQNGLVYATKSKNTEILRGHYGYDNGFYVSMMQTEFGKDSVVGNGKLLRHAFLDRAHDGPASFTKDNQKMVITKNKLGKKNNKDGVVLALYFSEMKDGKWSDLVPFEYNNDSYNVGHGCFSEDGNTLYFVSDMPGGQGGTDIYKSQLVDGKWSQPVNLGNKINTNMNEMFPFVDGNQLYFASDGLYGLGGLDIFTVNLKGNGTPVNMGYPVNSSADDFGLIAFNNEYGMKGYFSTNREDNIDRIYSFSKRKPKIDLIVNLFERNARGDVPMANGSFDITNTVNGSNSNVKTDKDGQFKTSLNVNDNLLLAAKLTNYKLLSEQKVDVTNVMSDSSFVVNLYLLPTTITVRIHVIDKMTKADIADANVKISNQITKEDTVVHTDENGMSMLVVNRNQDMLAAASKKNYIGDLKEFSTPENDGMTVDLKLELIAKAPDAKEGDSFVLKDILYDFNKATLRPESMKTLDKLAKYIMQNNYKVEMSAHTDSRGSNAYNLKLSQQRAQSCVDYLISIGVNKNLLVAKGYGETRLVNGCKDGVPCSEEEHQMNRRTEMTILKK